jgi:hypothetical protein
MIGRSSAARLCALVLALLVIVGTGALTSPADAAVHPEWGHTSARNGVLRPGCHGYHYHYEIHPPPGDWSLETFIIGPRGKHLASGTFLIGSDPLSGRGHYRLCRVTTRYGRYTIRAKLTVQNGYSDYQQGRLPASHFRLHAPRR